LMQSLNFAFPEEGPEKAAKRMSDYPVIGPLFQPNDAMGIISATYARVEHIKQVQQTFEELVSKGNRAEALAYAQKNLQELSAASIAGNFTQRMGEITKWENAVRSSSMTGDEKRKTLDKLRQLKITLASGVRKALPART
jgi:hypothetical protein